MRRRRGMLERSPIGNRNNDMFGVLVVDIPSYELEQEDDFRGDVDDLVLGDAFEGFAGPDLGHAFEEFLPESAGRHMTLRMLVSTLLNGIMASIQTM